MRQVLLLRLDDRVPTHNIPLVDVQPIIPIMRKGPPRMNMTLLVPPKRATRRDEFQPVEVTWNFLIIKSLNKKDIDALLAAV